MTPPRLKALRDSGVDGIGDLLYLFPRRYIDRSTVLPIRDISSGQTVTVIGRILQAEEAGFGRNKRLHVTIFDGTGRLEGVWFKGLKFFKKRFKPGKSGFLLRNCETIRDISFNEPPGCGRY